MATEFTVHLADRCEEADVLAFVAGELEGAELHPAVVSRDDLVVWTWSVDDAELARGRAILGVRALTKVRLKVGGGVAGDTWDAAFDTALRTASRILERFGDGLLLYNGEDIVLARRSGVTTRNSLWPWADYPGLADLVASFPAVELSDPKL
jgi:hypothetical protein